MFLRVNYSTVTNLQDFLKFLKDLTRWAVYSFKARRNHCASYKILKTTTNLCATTSSIFSDPLFFSDTEHVNQTIEDNRFTNILYFYSWKVDRTLYSPLFFFLKNSKTPSPNRFYNKIQKPELSFSYKFNQQFH